MRREWIEILAAYYSVSVVLRLPPCGGSGLKFLFPIQLEGMTCLPPCGGSGLKFTGAPTVIHASSCLPPCGGSGLKCPSCQPHYQANPSPSMRREWIEIQDTQSLSYDDRSPSMRREWIEIPVRQAPGETVPVSLHAEGVD